MFQPSVYRKGILLKPMHQCTLFKRFRLLTHLRSIARIYQVVRCHDSGNLGLDRTQKWLKVEHVGRIIVDIG